MSKFRFKPELFLGISPMHFEDEIVDRISSLNILINYLLGSTQKYANQCDKAQSIPGFSYFGEEGFDSHIANIEKKKL